MHYNRDVAQGAEGKDNFAGKHIGTGALLTLKSVQFDQIIQDIRRRSCYVELSEDEYFVLDYLMNMDFEMYQVK